MKLNLKLRVWELRVESPKGRSASPVFLSTLNFPTLN